MRLFQFSIRPLIYFLKRHWRPYALIAILSGIVAFLNGLNIALFLPMMNLILNVSEVSSDRYWIENWVDNIYRFFPNWSPLIINGLLLIVSTIIHLLFVGLTGFFVASKGGGIMATYRSKGFDIYRNGSYASILDQKAGELLYNIMIPPAKVGAVLYRISMLLYDGLEFLVLIGVLFSLNPLITGVFVAVALLGYLFVTYFTSRLFYNYSVVSRNVSSEINVLFSEFITGFKQIKIGNTQSIWHARYESLNNKLKRVYIDSMFHKPLPGLMIRSLMMLILIVAILLMSIVDQKAFVENLAFLGVVGMALIRMASAVARLNQHPIEIANSMADVERMHEVLHLDISAPVGGQIVTSQLQKAITFENINFTYLGRELLFDNFNLSFEKGVFSAVVGLSGSGKSSILNLLLGLYKPDSGRVLVDGLDLCDLDLDTWYRQIGYVSQDVVLFHASVLENIRNFNPRFSEKDVQKASHLSLAYDFIMELPQGFHTIIGERGMRLSGGQQQRLAIARAVLHDPDIILLDEATSNLDTASEHLVQKAIYAASKGRTVISIAHRLSTIIDADVIYVLDKGRVVEKGRHTDLLVQGGIYARLAKMQDRDGIISKGSV